MGTRFDGVVLCGGASRRMGQDKSLLPVDGVPMARRVADALVAAGAETVAGLGGDQDRLRDAGVETVADRWPGDGPLGAIVQALDEIGTAPAVVVLACDLIHPDPDAIARLLDGWDPQRCDVVVPFVAGRHQWTHALWDRRVGPIMGEIFAAGERSVVGACAGLRVASLRTLDPASTRDADRPEDLDPTVGAGAGGTDGVDECVPSVRGHS